MVGPIVVIFMLLSTSAANTKLGEITNTWIPLNFTQRPIVNRSVQTTESIWKESLPENIVSIQYDAIREVTPPTITYRRKPSSFYFSTPNINEDSDFFKEFNESADTIYGESSEKNNNVKINSNDYIESYYVPEIAKLNTNANSHVFGLTKTEENTVTKKIPSTLVTVLPVVNVTSKLKPSQIPEIGRLKPSEFSKDDVYKNHLRKAKDMDIIQFVNKVMNVDDKVSKDQQKEAKFQMELDKVVEKQVNEADSQTQINGVPEDQINEAESKTQVYKVAEDPLKEAESQTQLASVNGKKYEVTEPTTTETRTETTKYNKGYIYKKPVVLPLALAADRNALTVKLLENLSKYNINVDDVLNNYDDSKIRINRLGYTFNSFQHHPSPVILPFRYNSLNHLPTNPVLATFLSNYGYYLRGSFGRPNDFKNLYGYSASNNIHNNKPFGAYKVFSDTDSSN